jgi:MFS family permease
MSIFSLLKREQKEAIGLLQIGTFLEYFDLMLYVHMAVLLNELFFPKTDPHTAALLSAFAFCSTFVFRPFGALIFGYIGDHIGRKTTVIITTMMMSTSCVIMANLPTYAQVGITATWILTICRIVQGLSSMGEIIGCQIYITEITKPPAQYPAVAFIGVASSIGAVAALGIASLVTTTGFNWRIAFWIGAGIAVVGSIARVRLRETPEFVDKKRQLQKEIEEAALDETAKEFKLSTMKRLVEKKQKQKTSKPKTSPILLSTLR